MVFIRFTRSLSRVALLLKICYKNISFSAFIIFLAEFVEAELLYIYNSICLSIRLLSAAIYYSLPYFYVTVKRK